MHSIVFIELKTPPFKNRTWLTSMVCKRICDDPPTFLWVGVPLDTHPSIRPDDEHHAIRAEGSRCLRLTSIGPDLTRLEFCASLDLRGSLPQWLTDKVAVPTLLHVPYTIQVRTFRLPAAQAAVPLLVQKGSSGRSISSKSDVWWTASKKTVETLRTCSPTWHLRRASQI